jgi:hypothetical protein
MDEVRLYNHALSASDVATVYAFASGLPFITSQPQFPSRRRDPRASHVTPLTWLFYSPGIFLLRNIPDRLCCPAT